MKIQLSFETFGAIAAIIASFAALWVAWDQARIMRVQQYAAVIPIVSTDMTINQSESANIIELTITNVGVGPAMIRSAVPTFAGAPVPRWTELSDAMLGEDVGETMQLSASSAITVLGVGQTSTVLGVRWARSEEGDARLMRAARQIALDTSATLGIELCYCSVLDRCWMSSGEMRFPELVDGCEDSGDFLETFFQDGGMGEDRTAEHETESTEE